MKMFQDVGDVCTSATAQTSDTVVFRYKSEILTAVKSSMVPPVGSNIGIDKVAWTVEVVDYTVVVANDYCKTRSMQATVWVRPMFKEPRP